MHACQKARRSRETDKEDVIVSTYFTYTTSNLKATRTSPALTLSAVKAAHLLFCSRFFYSQLCGAAVDKLRHAACVGYLTQQERQPQKELP